MRSIMTLVIRMITDDETPHQVCGELTTVTDYQTYSFRDSQTLIKLLTDLSQDPPEQSSTGQIIAGETTPFYKSGETE